jgi:hypothetical protein
MPRTASPAGFSVSLTGPLAGVRPVKVLVVCEREALFPQARFGEPAAVRLGFGDRGLGKLDGHSFNPHSPPPLTLHSAQ